MDIHIYESKGKLTGTIEPENIPAAQAYLSADDMTQYLDESLAAVVLIEWRLDSGSTYTVRAITRRLLSDDELKELASWTSGQNSDGLGEGFEQQPFAERDDDECGECDGCENYGDCERDGWSMISFDWVSNDSAFTLVR